MAWCFVMHRDNFSFNLISLDNRLKECGPINLTCMTYGRVIRHRHTDTFLSYEIITVKRKDVPVLN